MTVHVRQKPSHEVKGIVWSAQTGLCRGTDLGKGTKVLKNTVASIILKWKKFGTTKTLPRASRPDKLSNQARRALVREGTKNPMVTLTNLDRIYRK